MLDGVIGGRAVGTRIKVAVTSGTNVGGVNWVGVAVRVDPAEGGGECDCQRTTKPARPRQYMQSVINTSRASSITSSLFRLLRCPYWS